MKSFFDCWVEAAASLARQTLAGAPELMEAPPQPLEAGGFGFAARLAGGAEGRFALLLDASLLEVPLLGEGVDQKPAWGEFIRASLEAACAAFLTGAGERCRVEACGEMAMADENACTRGLQLKSAARAWSILVRDEVRQLPGDAGDDDAPPAQPPALSRGLELLLDVELEASLRFGSQEMPLGQILGLGPGDVVQLDRRVSDPVDLIVGDKIVARGEVVLVDGNFGLRVTEVAAPQKRLESIRCLF
jgi:flagellar motor switch protein FliN